MAEDAVVEVGLGSLGVAVRAGQGEPKINYDTKALLVDGVVEGFSEYYFTAFLSVGVMCLTPHLITALGERGETRILLYRGEEQCA